MYYIIIIFLLYKVNNIESDSLPFLSLSTQLFNICCLNAQFSRVGDKNSGWALARLHHAWRRHFRFKSIVMRLDSSRRLGLRKL